MDNEQVMNEYWRLQGRRASIPEVRPGDFVDVYFDFGSPESRSYFKERVLAVEERPGSLPLVILERLDDRLIEIPGRSHRRHMMCDLAYVTHVIHGHRALSPKNPYRKDHYLSRHQSLMRHGDKVEGDLTSIAVFVLKHASYEVPGFIDEYKLHRLYAKHFCPGLKGNCYGYLQVNLKVFRPWLRRNITKILGNKKQADLNEITHNLEYEKEYWKEVEQEMETERAMKTEQEMTMEEEYGEA